MTIDARFQVFHEQHPEVYSALVQYARQARRAGFRKIGIAMLWERLRWYVGVERKGKDKYALNNDYRSRYARLITESEADLRTLFETRRIRTR